MKVQKYRNYRIRNIYPGGYAIERPDGTHWKTAPSYQNAILAIDVELYLKNFWSHHDLYV